MDVIYGLMYPEPALRSVEQAAKLPWRMILVTEPQLGWQL